MSQILMSAVDDENQQAQVNRLYRLWHWNEMNNYQSGQRSSAIKQFRLANTGWVEVPAYSYAIGKKECLLAMENGHLNKQCITLEDFEL